MHSCFRASGAGLSSCRAIARLWCRRMVGTAMDEVAGTELVVLVVATEPVDELEFYDEEDLLAATFERQLGDLERAHGPARFRRRVADERVELVAERPAEEEPMVIVVRIPLEHEDGR